MDVVLNQQHLAVLYDVLGHTNNGSTKKELIRLLPQSGIELVDDDSLNNGLIYKIELNM